MIRPAIFVNVMPISSNNFNAYYREQRALVDLSFFSDTAPDLASNAQNLEIANTIQNVLNTELKILDRSINLQELEFDTVDRIFHTTFNLMWYNNNEVTETYLGQFPNVQEIHISGYTDGDYYVYMTSEGEVYKKSEGGFYILLTAAEVTILRDDGYIII